MDTVLVYVHGLWLGGGESLLLRRRLEQALDCETRVFRYASMAGGMTGHARALAAYLAAIRAGTVHLVGHSLGGVLLLRCFEVGCVPAPPGRVVFLGSPLRGSRAAERLARLPLGLRLLGASAREELLSPRPRRWESPRELGVIAGDRPVGLGRLLGNPGGPSDGTVLVEETRIEGARAHLQLPVSHAGFMWSPAVAQQTAAFLRDGRFTADQPRSSSLSR